ncbi:BTB/POZ domain-containing protein [Candidatus Dependentiae bacterium]|nr:BTB/POZ domain-containing protein [Candidatus Dependentiae bacterium]
MKKFFIFILTLSLNLPANLRSMDKRNKRKRTSSRSLKAIEKNLVEKIKNLFIETGEKKRRIKKRICLKNKEEVLEVLRNPDTNLNFFNYKLDPVIKKLDLSVEHLDDKQIKKLSEILKENTSLKSLNLSNNKIGPEGVKALAEALKTNSSLEALGLSNNEIGPEGAKAIAQALKTNSYLKTLNLEYNEIDPKGARAIAKALKNNSSLELLGLSFNKIGPEGIIDIAKALETNSSLELLDFRYNGISAVGEKALAEALEALEKNHTRTEKLKIFPTDEIIKKTIEKIIPRNRFLKGFFEMFVNQYLADTEINGIGFNESWVTKRLGIKIIKLQKFLKFKKPEVIKAFLLWTYTGYTKEEHVEEIKTICEELNILCKKIEIDFEKLNGYKNFKNFIIDLYNTREETGDFTIIVKGEEIKAHKFILMAKSGTFRDMFSTVKEGDSVSDYYGATPEEFEQLLKIIYTREIPKFEYEEEKEKFLDLLDFYQVD